MSPKQFDFDVVVVGGGGSGLAAAASFVVEGTMIGVFHVDGDFYALGDRCPHAGASLACGDVNGYVVCCRIHQWRFSIRDGTYLDEEKPDFNVQSYSVRVVGDQVQVEV